MIDVGGGVDFLLVEELDSGVVDGGSGGSVKMIDWTRFRIRRHTAN